MTRARVRSEPATAPPRRLGVLPDGTPYYAPPGELLVDGDRVCCHLCGQWFLSVASHLRAHGWTRSAYVAVFELEHRATLAGPATHERRSAALRARQTTEDSIRAAQILGRVRARSGELAAAAARANRGRRHPLQRRPKTLAALAAASPENRRAGSVRHARRHLLEVAAKAAAEAGHPDFHSFLVDRLRAGLSLAAISREAGLHKDWLSRHLGDVAPELVVSDLRPDPLDLRWLPVVGGLGFTGVADYLHARHVEQHRTIRAIADEVGFSRESVAGALRRHGIEPTVHAGKRHAATTRDRLAAAKLGCTSLAGFVTAAREEGTSWARLAEVTGIPETTLRRRRSLITAENEDQKLH